MGEAICLRRKKMKLNDRKWESFTLGELFDLQLSKGDNQIGKLTSGDVPLVSAGETLNGIVGFVANGERNSQKFEANQITIDMFGKPYYREFDFYAVSHGRVNILKSPELSKEVGLFISQCIEMQKSKFGFSNMANNSRLKRCKILLPVSENHTPDWDFMENYIRCKLYQIKENYKLPEFHDITDTRELIDVDWGNFFIGDISKIAGGKDWESYNRTSGVSPFVGASSMSNGVTDFVDYAGHEKQVEDGVISINRNGSVGYAFYHPYKAYFSGDTRFLEINNFKGNKFINQFIVSSIQKQKGKYAYGYKMGTERIKRQTIKLPVKKNEPDFEFMEQYMKRIENKVLAKTKTFLMNN